MSVTKITTDFIGEVGVNPRLVRVICNDTYATVTEANYLLPLLNEGYVFYPTDYFFVMYGSSSKSPALLTATITPTTITLAPFSPANGVTYTGTPVVGDFAKFSSSTGQIADTGMTPSDATKTKLAAVNGATVVNQVATFSDVNGTVQTSGTLLSALQLSANIKANTATYGGGGTSTTYTITGVTTSSLVWSWITASTNNSSVLSSKVLSANTVTVNFSADPGAGTIIAYIAFIAPQ